MISTYLLGSLTRSIFDNIIKKKITRRLSVNGIKLNTNNIKKLEEVIKTNADKLVELNVISCNLKDSGGFKRL